MPRFRIGTSGFDYDPWKGVFYPAELPRKQRLAWYAGKLGALEINASFYRKPSPETVRGWAEQVPAEFRFALKAWQRITHQKRLRDCGELVSVFADAARELGERAGPILYQLPPLHLPGVLLDRRIRDAPALRAVVLLFSGRYALQ